MSKRTRKPSPFRPMSVQQWAAEYPEARVTRRELYAVLTTVLGPPKAAETGQPQEEVQA